MKSIEKNTYVCKCTGCRQTLHLTLVHMNKNTKQYICVYCESTGRPYDLIPVKRPKRKTPIYDLSHVQVTL